MSESAHEIKEALLTLDKEKLIQTTKTSLDKGENPQEILSALTAALRDVGEKFESGEFFLVELVSAGEAAKTVISKYLKPALEKIGAKSKHLGVIVIGTVAGDIHDIGKSIVTSMLFAAGFEILDLGVDVSAEKFIETVKKGNVDVVAMSALLSTTLPMQRETIEALKEKDLRNKVKVIVGGSPVTEEWVKEIGADGYADNASEAVRLVKKLLNINE
jgi:corrinoid protein of di/trimethylamine methyltransferase